MCLMLCILTMIGDDSMKKIVLILTFILLLFPMNVYANEDTYISDTAYNACAHYGEEYNICPELLMAIIERESSGQADAENDGCMGLMQISVKWHKERMDRLGVTDIFNEEQNIHVAADYLAELFDRHEEVYLVLMCYNMGESSAQKLFDKGICESNYAVEICERAEELERLHGK